MSVNCLPMTCDKCRVASTCPSAGLSPLVVGTRKILCRIIGPYGRVPADRSILSEESKERADRDGPCLTLAELPVLDLATGEVKYEVLKIFSPPVLHEREKTNDMQNLLYPKNHL